MDIEFETKDSVKLQKMLSKIAKTLAFLEQAEEKLQAREEAIQRHEELITEKLSESEKQVNKILSAITTFQEDLEENLNELGVARFKLVLKQGEEHVRAIQETTDAFKLQSEQTLETLDKTALQVNSSLSKAVSAFNIHEIRKLVDESCFQIKKASQSSLRQISLMSKWFYAKNIGFITSLILIISMVIGLYINDEWPWETHSKIAQERNLAQALITAWPNLNSTDQEKIARNASTKIK